MMSDRADTPTPPGARLTASERDWIRRQARSARVLAAEQHLWVLRTASKGTPVAREAHAPTVRH